MLKSGDSKLRRVGLGIVLQDKEDKSDEIIVYLPEEFPFIDGKIADHKVKNETQLPDKEGVIRKTKSESTVGIKATWLGAPDSIRITSPDVVKNETVEIYRYADEQRYYWTKRGREPGLRRLETVLFGISNLPEARDGTTGWDKSSGYWVEMSTKLKHVILKTSKKSGEKFDYEYYINAKEGIRGDRDSLNNHRYINTEEKYITDENADGTFHRLDKRKYHQYAEERMCLDSPDISIGWTQGCGNNQEHPECYVREYVITNKDLTIARIGNKRCVYTHHDQDDIFQKSNAILSQKSKDHTVEPSNSYTLKTITETIKSTNKTETHDTRDITTKTHTENNTSRTLTISGPYVVNAGSISFNGWNVPTTLGEHKDDIASLKQTIADHEARIKALEAKL